MSGEAEDRSPGRVYQARLDRGVFQIQICEECRRHVFYPRAICPHCGSLDLAWSTPSGLGTVYSTTVVRTPADPAEHYNVCLVDLDEGVRLMSRVEGKPPQDVRIGMRVRASISIVDGTGTLVFKDLKEAT